MKVPLLDLRAQLESIEAEMKAAVLEVVDSTRYIMGPKVEELERQIAEYVGTRHAVGVSSGTDALLVSLMALGIQPGDLVITTPYSFFATAGVIARLNARPVFVDIDPDTYNLDVRALQAWFDGAGADVGRVKAIIPVHLYGQCADMPAIMRLAQAHGIPVVEDAAQAIGSACPTPDGLRKAGAIGDFGCFSFFPSKNLGALGDGGMVVTNSDEHAERLRRLRNHGSQPKYYHQFVGGNFRLDALQAATLLVKLPHLESWHAGRRRNAAYYDEHLRVDGVQTPRLAYERDHHIYNQYVISVPRDRDGLRSFLADSQIGTEVYYPVPFHRQECFAYLGYADGEFPHAEHAAEHTLALPVYSELTHQMQDHVVEKIGEFHAH